MLKMVSKQTVGGERATSRPDLLDDLEKTHEATVRFVSARREEDFDLADVEWRIRVDTHEHYEEHAQDVRRWLR